VTVPADCRLFRGGGGGGGGGWGLIEGCRGGGKRVTTLCDVGSVLPPKDSQEGFANAGATSPKNLTYVRFSTDFWFFDRKHVLDQRWVAQSCWGCERWGGPFALGLPQDAVFNSASTSWGGGGWGGWGIQGCSAQPGSSLSVIAALSGTGTMLTVPCPGELLIVVTP